MNWNLGLKRCNLRCWGRRRGVVDTLMEQYHVQYLNEHAQGTDSSRFLIQQYHITRAIGNPIPGIPTTGLLRLRPRALLSVSASSASFVVFAASFSAFLSTFAVSFATLLFCRFEIFAAHHFRRPYHTSSTQSRGNIERCGELGSSYNLFSREG